MSRGGYEQQAMLRPRDLGPGASTRTFLEAMSAGRLHLARFVLDAVDGTIVDCRADRGRTPLMYAVALKDPAWRVAFARLLLERRAAVDLRDDAGRSALSLACERGYLDVTKLLVQYGADPDAADSRGWNPLMYAAWQGRAPVVEWLLRSFRRLGLCLERADRAGRTALQLAASEGHGRCVRALRASGALILELPEPATAPPGDGPPAARSPRGDGGAHRREREDDDDDDEEQRGPDASAAQPGSDAGRGGASLRGRPLIRRATAPDCQSLLGY
ncbi:ankyrin repeat domain-containing protein 63 [Lacerta agilis]|uniref:ankyrin repeat domain-containing protein 63 n=1 Tax=Lacerta agilis TaxID=80427 RepID=UPI00141A336E|nr:ankyrin repeat domain-containing protein 63 [Lacerta agilis]